MSHLQQNHLERAWTNLSDLLRLSKVGQSNPYFQQNLWGILCALTFKHDLIRMIRYGEISPMNIHKYIPIENHIIFRFYVIYFNHSNIALFQLKLFERHIESYLHLDSKRHEKFNGNHFVYHGSPMWTAEQMGHWSWPQLIALEACDLSWASQTVYLTKLKSGPRTGIRRLCRSRAVAGIVAVMAVILL